MATSKSFFGKRRGSTKNFTFAVFNGKQVTKEKAEQVKNPRTLAQMRNRMIPHNFLSCLRSHEGNCRPLLPRATFMACRTCLASSRSTTNCCVPTSWLPRHSSLTPTMAMPAFSPVHTSFRKAHWLPSPRPCSHVPSRVPNSVAFTLQPGVTAAELTADAIISALGLQVGELATLLPRRLRHRDWLQVRLHPSHRQGRWQCTVDRLRTSPSTSTSRATPPWPSRRCRRHLPSSRPPSMVSG